jgi:hypothetical protein
MSSSLREKLNSGRLTVLLIWMATILPSVMENVKPVLDVQRFFTLCGPHSALDIILNRNDVVRFRPVWWLMHHFAYLAFGEWMPGHFFFQAVVLLATGLLLYELARLDGREGWKTGLLAALIFIFPTTAENGYTLAKSEPILALFCVLAVYGVRRALSEELLPKAGWGAWFPFVFIAAAGAIWTKESGLSIVGFIGGLGLGWVVLGDRSRSVGTRFIALAMLVTVVLYWLPNRFLKVTSVYDFKLSDISIRNSLFNAFTYATKFPELILLLALIAVTAWYARRSGSGRLVFAASLLLGAAACMAILLIWKWPCGYFLFPAQVWAVAALIVVWGGLPKEASTRSVLAVGAMCVAFCVPSFAQTVLLQRACWSGFYGLSRKVADTPAKPVRFVIADMVTESEPIAELNEQFKHDQPNAGFQAIPGGPLIGFDIDPTTPDTVLKEGDFILFRRYENAFGKHVRMLQDVNTIDLIPRFAALGIRLEPVAEKNFSMPSMYPYAGFLRPVKIEHRLFRVAGAPTVTIQPGPGLWRTDNWVSPEIAFQVNPGTKPLLLSVEGSVPPSGPTTISFTVDGRAAGRVTVTSDSPFKLEIPLPGARTTPAEVRIVADRFVFSESLGLRPKQQKLSWRLTSFNVAEQANQ